MDRFDSANAITDMAKLIDPVIITVAYLTDDNKKSHTKALRHYDLQEFFVMCSRRVVYLNKTGKKFKLLAAWRRYAKAMVEVYADFVTHGDSIPDTSDNVELYETRWVGASPVRLTYRVDRVHLKKLKRERFLTKWRNNAWK